MSAQVWVRANGSGERAGDFSGMTESDEKLSAEIYIRAEQTGTDYKPVRDEAFRLMSMIEAALHEDVTLGGVCEQGITTPRWRTDESFPDDRSECVGIILTVDGTSTIGGPFESAFPAFQNAVAECIAAALPELVIRQGYPRSPT